MKAIYSKFPLLHHHFPTLCEALGLEGLRVMIAVNVTVAACRFEDGMDVQSAGFPREPSGKMA